MQITLHIDIKKPDSDYEKAINEYFKRISAFANISKKLYKDFSKLKLKKNSYKYIVIQGSNSPTSTKLAKKISDIGLTGYSCIEFLISEKNIYADTYIDKDIFKNKSINLSGGDFEIFNLTSMNIGVELTAVVLSEQIYRAYTINNNIIYHK